MEREPFNINHESKFYTENSSQEKNLQNTDYEKNSEIQNPYKRLLWDFVSIDTIEIEERVNEQKSLLKKKNENNFSENNDERFALNYLTTIRENIAMGLGMSLSEQESIHGYDFAFDKWNLWRIQSDHQISQEEKTKRMEQLDKMIRFNWATTLRERHRVASSTTNLFSIEGQLYSELWLSEALENIYVRGAAVRQNDGSQESSREMIETFVFIASQNLLLEKNKEKIKNKQSQEIPLGTRIISLSPPSIKSDLYPDNYVDVMELKENKETKEKYVALTRYKGTLSHDDYEKTLLEQNSSYSYLFADKALTKDERIKNTALIVFPEDSLPESDRLCEEYFGIDKKAIKDTEFQETVLVACKPAINEYMRAILQDPVNWQEVHTSYENILKMSDETVKQLQEHRDLPSYQFLVSSIESTLGQQEYLFPNQRQVLIESTLDEVKAGCGPTGSYTNKEDPYGLNNYLSNLLPFEATLAAFGIDTKFEEKDKDGRLKANCPNCNKEHRRERGGWIYKCTRCGSDKISCGRKQSNLTKISLVQPEQPVKVKKVGKSKPQLEQAVNSNQRVKKRESEEDIAIDSSVLPKAA